MNKIGKRICKTLVCGFGLALMSCSSDVAELFHVKNVSDSGCKEAMPYAARFVSNQDGRNKETVSLRSIGNGYLSYTHANACYTCEAEFSVKADIEKNTITITEEAPPATNCICLYDVTAEIGPLDNGEYTLVMVSNNMVRLKETIHVTKSTQIDLELPY